MTGIVGLFFYFAISFAGPGVNNGGGVWQCKKATGEVLWTKTHDLLSNNEFLSSGRHFQSTDSWDIYREVLKLIDVHFQDLGRFVSTNSPIRKEEVIFVDEEIAIIHDSHIFLRPVSRLCPNGFISYAQAANFLSLGYLIFDRKIWESSSFLAVDKAALLVHETVYKSLRETFGDSTSRRTNDIVYALFSNSSIPATRSWIQHILWGRDSDNRERPRVALFEIDVRCQVEEKKRGIWEPIHVKEKLKEFEAASWDFKGFRFHLRASSDGIPEILSISNPSAGTNFSMDPGEIRSGFISNKRIFMRLNAGERQIRFGCINKR